MKKKFFLLFLLCTGFAYSQCNIIYVTSTAGAAAGTMADPTSLNDALSGATNGMVIRLAIGTYTIDNPITLPTDGITIEGGFDPALAWRKTSQAGATVISRSALNPEGAANQQRLVAFYAIGRSNFRFQDLTITTANATGNGMSTYGIHLNGCSNYNIVRCQILPGNASAGAGDDNPAAYNSTWDGANGGNGVNGITGGGPQCTCSLTTDNGGTGGNGGAGGAGGANAAPIGGSAGGGNAGGRGGDGRPDNTGGAGFAGTAGGGAAPGAGGTGGAADGNGNSTSNVGNGGAGGAGTAGTNGAAGTATHIVGYFVPGAGTNGTAGTGGSGGGGGGGAGRDTDNCDAAGGGGSGGGGGGGGGGAARGGFGGGGVFGIYLYNNGASGNVIQCRILPGAAGAAGLGGIGGNGGNGGTAVIGNGCTNGDTDGNRGGDGGNGGAGGVGGNGGNGSAGVSTNIHVNGGTGLVNNDNAFNLAAQPVIFMQNVNCTYQNITFSSGASALWNFAGCSSPAGPTGASVITQYTCTGRNNVTYSGGLYTGFAYISCARSTSTIAPTACTSYLSPAGNNYTVTGPYTDVITNSQGCDSVITINLTILGTTSLTWNAGGSTTVWGTAANWNTCGTPLCGVDAVVNTAALQPVLTAGTYSVRDLTINAGATVTIQNGATLQICGNLTNNGTLICQAGSNVEFVGTGLQTISGNFPASQFHHFTVTKNTGTVIITSDIVVNGNFTTTNNTSVFNNNNRNIQLFGDFLNANGNTTFTNSGTTGGLFFAGTNTQAFNAGVTQLDLNIVNINKAANGVNLNTNMNIKTVTGELQLINGDYTTGVFHIEFANTAVTSVNGGSATSYVNGNLWRSVLPTGGSYDLPVGSPTWYERVNINLLGTNTYTQLQARYDNWPSGPNILGLSECMATYNLPSEDHGYWTINQTGGNTGNYNATLYCFGATNTAGVTGWTIQKSSSVAGPWTLSGTCDMTSTAAIVKRNNMTGFSVLAAAQSTLPLPVELVEFSGTAQGTFNHLYWTTSSEINNDYFIVEKSYDGVQYEWLGEVAGSGNSNTIHNYSLSDERPANVTYYKLTQFDYNGQSETYGPIVLSNNQVESFSFVSIFPNPAKNLFYINMYSEELANVSFLIQDALGRQVHFSEKEILSNYKLEVNSIDWKPGVYFVKVYCTKYNFEKTIKLIIQ